MGQGSGYEVADLLGLKVAGWKVGSRVALHVCRKAYRDHICDERRTPVEISAGVLLCLSVFLAHCADSDQLSQQADRGVQNFLRADRNTAIITAMLA